MILRRCGARDFALLCCTSRRVIKAACLRGRCPKRGATGVPSPLHDTRATTHRFWSRSGLVLRLAVALLRDMPGGRRLLTVVGQRSLTGPLRVLEYVHRCAAAQRHGQSFALGTYHSAAMLSPVGVDSKAQARLHTFGRGFHGQLGRGDFEDSSRPVQVRAFETSLTVVAVHCGGSHCAVVRDAATGPEVHTWGLASSGELGHGGWTPIEVCKPRLVASLKLRVRVREVCTGSNHTLVVGTCGGLWACGRGRPPHTRPRLSLIKK
jgi:E3 ubiquitin-protein ligase HERC3